MWCHTNWTPLAEESSVHMICNFSLQKWKTFACQLGCISRHHPCTLSVQILFPSVHTCTKTSFLCMKVYKEQCACLVSLVFKPWNNLEVERLDTYRPRDWVAIDIFFFQKQKGGINVYEGTSLHSLVFVWQPTEQVLHFLSSCFLSFLGAEVSVYHIKTMISLEVHCVALMAKFTVCFRRYHHRFRHTWDEFK